MPQQSMACLGSIVGAFETAVRLKPFRINFGNNYFINSRESDTAEATVDHDGCLDEVGQEVGTWEGDVATWNDKKIGFPRVIMGSTPAGKDDQLHLDFKLNISLISPFLPRTRGSHLAPISIFWPFEMPIIPMADESISSGNILHTVLMAFSKYSISMVVYLFGSLGETPKNPTMNVTKPAKRKIGEFLIFGDAHISQARFLKTYFP